MKVFSSKNRPVHKGPFPCELLTRQAVVPDLETVPAHMPLSYVRADDPRSIINAMAEYQAMLDAIRNGKTNPQRAACPDDPVERAEHLKSFGYFCDAAIVGACLLPQSAVLPVAYRNPALDRLVDTLQTRQTKTLAAGIDVIMADLRDSVRAPERSISPHSHALVLLYENPRDPDEGEDGVAFI